MVQAHPARTRQRQGAKLPSGENAKIGLVDVIEAAQKHPLYTAPKTDGEGVGVAVGGWGGAFGAAAALCRVEPDGSLTVQIGTVDISGSSTGLALLAAETFGVPLDKVQVELGRDCVGLEPSWDASGTLTGW